MKFYLPLILLFSFTNFLSPSLAVTADPTWFPIATVEQYFIRQDTTSWVRPITYYGINVQNLRTSLPSTVTPIPSSYQTNVLNLYIVDCRYSTNLPGPGPGLPHCGFSMHNGNGIQIFNATPCRVTDDWHIFPSDTCLGRSGHSYSTTPIGSDDINIHYKSCAFWGLAPKGSNQAWLPNILTPWGDLSVYDARNEYGELCIYADTPPPPCDVIFDSLIIDHGFQPPGSTSTASIRGLVQCGVASISIVGGGDYSIGAEIRGNVSSDLVADVLTITSEMTILNPSPGQFSTPMIVTVHAQ